MLAAHNRQGTLDVATQRRGPSFELRHRWRRPAPWGLFRGRPHLRTLATSTALLLGLSMTCCATDSRDLRVLPSASEPSVSQDRFELRWGELTYEMSSSPLRLTYEELVETNRTLHQFGVEGMRTEWPEPGLMCQLYFGVYGPSPLRVLRVGTSAYRELGTAVEMSLRLYVEGEMVSSCRAQGETVLELTQVERDPKAGELHLVGQYHAPAFGCAPGVTSTPPDGTPLVIDFDLRVPIFRSSFN